MGSSERPWGTERSAALATLAYATALAACSQSNGASAVSEAGLTDVTVVDAPSTSGGGAATDAGPLGDAGLDAELAPTCITPTTPQTCAPPEMTALPICKLSQTGCMNPTNPTRIAANAVYYEVNSPLWSDDAAKQRAFVLPDGGTIHVKNCMPDAGPAALAECVSDAGVPSGTADTGKWEFPVGTVMIKSFIFGGKLVETRLLMHVDAATAGVIQNGTDWVGYNYAWNDEQTEATVVPDERTTGTFSVPSEAGTQSVAWNYPSFLDCVGCHSAVVGTIGPETDQMNRVVDGGNQIDTFEARGFFDDTAPKKPYAAAMVEPYANAALGLAGPPDGSTVDEGARSYLAANCGFCHRPDVNDQGFDLRYGLTLAQTGICGLMQQNGIPGMATTPYLDLAPGDHAGSAMWIRMNTPVPASDPGEEYDVGRMPPVASFVVDTQAVSLVGTWIDSIAICPAADAGM
jgi:cytochrome c551/c552